MLKDKIATFEKVSLSQYLQAKKSFYHTDKYDFDEEFYVDEYNKIKIPSRSTSGSVGFDFYLPFDIELGVGECIIIPTGIRCRIEEGFSLDIYPKSGLGFKNFTTIANT